MPLGIPATQDNVGVLSNLATKERVSVVAALNDVGQHARRRARGISLNGVDEAVSRAYADLGPGDFLSGSNLVSNGTFEAYSGAQDDGNSDTITDWTDVGGAGSLFESTATAKNGSAALKLESDTAVAIGRQTVAVDAATTYGLIAWARDSGSNPTRWGVYDVTNGAWIQAYTTTGVTGVTYGVARLFFTTPAGCTSIRIDLVAPSGANDAGYFDDVNLRQVYDFSIVMRARRTAGNGQEREYLACQLSEAADRIWSIRFIGNQLGDPAADYGKVRFAMAVDGTTDSYGVTGTVPVIENHWFAIVCTFTVVSATASVIRIYKGGVLEGIYSSARCPLFPGESPLTIGRTDVTGNYHWFEGDVGEFQIVRGYAMTAADVKDVCARASAPAGYEAGEVVCHYIWNGDTDTEIGEDHSGKDNDLTLENVAVADLTDGPSGHSFPYGSATLTAGAVTVTCSAVTDDSMIILTSQADGGTPGYLRVSARVSGTSFTITSSSGSDTSTVAWLLVEP